jgi:hypothetical protein
MDIRSTRERDRDAFVGTMLAAFGLLPEPPAHQIKFPLLIRRLLRRLPGSSQ